MSRDQFSSSLIIRVKTNKMGLRILVHDLRAQEVLEFSSWTALVRYLKLSSRTGGLR